MHRGLPQRTVTAEDRRASLSNSNGRAGSTRTQQNSTTLTEVREENIMRQRAAVVAFLLLVAIWVASPLAQAANVTVNCDKNTCGA